MELGLFVAELLKDRKKVHFHVPDDREYGEFSLDWRELMELGAQAHGDVLSRNKGDSFIVWHNFEMPPTHEGTIIVIEDTDGESAVICQRINAEYTDIVSRKVYSDDEIYRWAELPLKLKGL